MTKLLQQKTSHWFRGIFYHCSIAQLDTLTEESINEKHRGKLILQSHQACAC